MSLFKKLFGETSSVPSIPPWEKLPSLSIAVFGSPEKTPDLQNVNRVFLDVVSNYFRVSEKEWAEKRAAIEEFYQRKVSNKLQVVQVPNVSELGSTNRARRLYTARIEFSGMIWLLINEGARILLSDASRIPSVLAEFIENPKCMLVQGKGYHAFVRADFTRYESLDGGRTSDIVRRAGFIAKRVKYLTIDPRKSDPYEL
jgi:hypothetical protein